MAIQNTKTPFTKMSFTPDIPSGSLGPNEYNIGLNVETDTRGIRKVNGDQDILAGIPGDPIFVVGNFRANDQFNFIVATIDGNWYAIGSGNSTITVITPTIGSYIANRYSHNTRITASWNGDVLFINDTVNPPMFIGPTDSQFILYDAVYAGSTPSYIWNYYPNWSNVTAGFMRMYSTPNIGSILVAGNLSYTVDTVNYNAPNTLRWSQNFGLNAAPLTWAPTYTNTANEVDVPVRGPLIDGFPLNGNFYLFSYWDCVIMQPISYTSSSAPVFGISLVTQGRGLLNENCWCINDSMAFGVDSSDIWILNNGAFAEIGNQRVKNFFYSNLNPAYTNQVFMVNNTRKNQMELYFPDLTSTTGRCNKMLGYRYDLDCWNPPREIYNAVMACEGPTYDTAGVPNIANRGVVYARSGIGSRLIQQDVGNGFFNGSASANINSYFRRDNINFGEPYSNLVQVHRVLPEVYGTGTFTMQVGGADSVGQTPTFTTTATIAINTSDPWIQTQQNTHRVASVIASSNDSTDTWIMTEANWQITITGDAR